MKIKSSVLLAIVTTAISIPAIVYAHPGHGAGSISSFLHQVIYHVNDNLLLVLIALFVGLSLRVIKKSK
jgi:hypothetical protein